MKTHPAHLLCTVAAALALAGCDASSRRLVQKGQRALEDNQPRAAVAAFEKAAKRAARDPSLYYNLACAHLALGEKKPAMNAIEEGLKIEPANVRLLQLKAHTAHMNGDWKAARETLREAAAAGAPEPYVLNARATLERMEKNYDQARLLLLQAMRLDPAYPATYYNLASLYQDHFKNDRLLPQARDLFMTYALFSPLPKAQSENTATYLDSINKMLARETVPQTSPDKTSLSSQRMAEAKNFEAARNWDSAIRAYNDAINNNALSLEPRLALAALHEKRNNAAAAGNTYIEAASKITNATITVLYKAAEAAIAQKRYDLAAEFASRGLASAPGDYRFFYQMAVARAYQNRRPDARAYAEHCALLAPDPAFANRVKAWAADL